MKKITVLLLTIISLNSCQSSNDQKTITIENRYSVALPSFLTKSNGLNVDASLQYEHPLEDFYVIVIDESKSEVQKALEDNNLTETYSNNIKSYSKLILTVFEQSITVSHKSKIIDTTINNMPARILTVRGIADGVDVFYSLAFIQGKKRYYQIMAWTLLNKESEYKDEMKRIKNSLKEL